MKLSDERISPEYLKTQEEMHTGLHKTMQYGSIAYTLFSAVIEPMVRNSKSKSVFDYGCGKQYLRKLFEDMGIEYGGYDPAIKKYSTLDLSKQYDMVVCIDVMEHVEVKYHDIVLQDIAKLAKEYILLTISPAEAKKVLSDGRNAHICQAGPSYWLPKICKYFEPIQMANCIDGVAGFYVMCRRNKKNAVINQMGTSWDGSFEETTNAIAKRGLPGGVPITDPKQVEYARKNYPGLLK